MKRNSALDKISDANPVARIDEAKCIGCGDCVNGCTVGCFSMEIVREGTLPLELCIGCGLCETKCPMGAIKERKRAAHEPDRCSGCGDCVTLCPAQAILLVRPDEAAHGRGEI